VCAGPPNHFVLEVRARSSSIPALLALRTQVRRARIDVSSIRRMSCLAGALRAGRLMVSGIAAFFVRVANGAKRALVTERLTGLTNRVIEEYIASDGIGPPPTKKCVQ
jgi:hypothetical protein